MPATVWSEVQRAFAGTLRLARGDRQGLYFFDRSLDGFWRSFRAAAICYPLYIVLLTMRVTVAEWQEAGGGLVILVQSIAYVIGWVAFPLATLALTRRLGCEERFFDFMVPYNWFQLPQSLLFVLVGLESEAGVLGSATAQAIETVAVIAVLAYEWFLARVSLEIPGPAAALVVVIDVVLGVVIDWVATSLY
jgi:hypothetical protein